MYFAIVYVFERKTIQHLNLWDTFETKTRLKTSPYQKHFHTCLLAAQKIIEKQDTDSTEHRVFNPLIIYST